MSDAGERKRTRPQVILEKLRATAAAAQELARTCPTTHVHFEMIVRDGMETDMVCSDAADLVAILLALDPQTLPETVQAWLRRGEVVS